METEECMFKNAEEETREEQNQDLMLWKEKNFRVRLLENAKHS